MGNGKINAFSPSRVSKLCCQFVLKYMQWLMPNAFGGRGQPRYIKQAAAMPALAPPVMGIDNGAGMASVFPYGMPIQGNPYIPYQGEAGFVDSVPAAGAADGAEEVVHQADGNLNG
jgi:hypothetical protein